ncbi:uncharacterized protein K02A2.6-like [Rhagoletis pomonella]|uniref:uncharacterized protein K02A2.6-like n=1 Tax=Rhagoletis pomonella TaxID=28610 RepID=UPI0017825AA0|nr:uncharacterized protein K02A2.6-like [Rhagoletis pomonella]
MKHRESELITHVDCLSRAPAKDSSNRFTYFLDDEVNAIQIETVNTISTNIVTAISIAKETGNDPELAELRTKLINGKIQDPEYTIQSDIVLKGQRVMIPKSLRGEILKELHYTHLGIVKMKQMARRYCYWKGIDADIENLVKSCHDCAMVRKDPAQITTHSWEQPQENFERVHMDYAGPFQNHFFVVLIDAKSKWPEIRVIKNAPTSESTIDLLEDIFSTHGLPQVLVSDNATIFQSKSFRLFCQSNGIVQKFIAPGHPATNGLAERHIQTLKNKLEAMQHVNIPMRKKVQEIVSRYRITPLENNKTPAEIYLGRKTRTRLDAIKPVHYGEATSSPMEHGNSA